MAVKVIKKGKAVFNVEAAKSLGKTKFLKQYKGKYLGDIEALWSEIEAAAKSKKN